MGKRSATLETIFHDLSGEIAEVHVKTIDQLLCVECIHHDGRRPPCLFLIKFEERKCWYWFYLDVWFCVWERLYQLPDDDLDDPEEFPWYDLSETQDLKGVKIIMTEVSATADLLELRHSLCDRRIISLSMTEYDGDSALTISQNNTWPTLHLTSICPQFAPEIRCHLARSLGFNNNELIETNVIRTKSYELDIRYCYNNCRSDDGHLRGSVKPPKSIKTYLVIICYSGIHNYAQKIMIGTKNENSPN